MNDIDKDKQIQALNETILMLNRKLTEANQLLKQYLPKEHS